MSRSRSAGGKPGRTRAYLPRWAVLALRGTAAGALVALVLAWGSSKPSNHRTWIPEQSVLATARFDGSRVHVHGVRDFRWTGGSPAPSWQERTYDLERLQSLWFVLSPFGKRWRGPAHAMLSFGFTDSTFVTISVEARKEPGERYSIWKGLLRRYELMYVLADEQDVLPLRAAVHGNDVLLYPLRASPAKIRELFVSMLLQANDLARHPRFYNTLVGNCTTVLLRHANEVAERPLPGGWRIVFPGYSDRVLYDAGLIATDLPLAQARAHFLASDRILRCAGAPDFSVCLRRAPQP